jgi:hypothetical protein
MNIEATKLYLEELNTRCLGNLRWYISDLDGGRSYCSHDHINLCANCEQTLEVYKKYYGTPVNLSKIVTTYIDMIEGMANRHTTAAMQSSDEGLIPPYNTPRASHYVSLSSSIGSD